MRRNYDPADRARLEDLLIRRRLNGETFEQICATPGWPSRPTLRRWARETPYLADAARDARRAARPPAATRIAFDPTLAAELLRRVRWGEPIADLIREPHLPHRRALNAWKAAHPDFAAALAAAKADIDPERRRYGRRRARPRPGDEAIQDRIMLAVIRGATLPQLHADPTLPTATGLRRLRRADPAFDGALTAALATGHKARARARAAARCTPALTEKIEHALIEGASLASLGDRPGFPGRTTLYAWVRTHPAFARAVANACEFRDAWVLGDDAFDRAARGDRPGANALLKRLGQLNPHPGQRRQGPAR